MGRALRGRQGPGPAADEVGRRLRKWGLGARRGRRPGPVQARVACAVRALAGLPAWGSALPGDRPLPRSCWRVRGPCTWAGWGLAVRPVPPRPERTPRPPEVSWRSPGSPPVGGAVVLPERGAGSPADGPSASAFRCRVGGCRCWRGVTGQPAGLALLPAPRACACSRSKCPLGTWGCVHVTRLWDSKQGFSASAWTAGHPSVVIPGTPGHADCPVS